MPALFWLAPFASAAALACAWGFFQRMARSPDGDARMVEIGGHIRRGAMAYLRQQYRVLLVVFALGFAVFAALAYGAGIQNKWLPATFVCGGVFSALAGYFGMRTATLAAPKTAAAARRGLPPALRVAFRSGAVMGLLVVGFGLLNVAGWLYVIDRFTAAAAANPGTHWVAVTTGALTFGMGASLQALFARVGGGIFTKAADVGADLVGKVEAGIPEDDPRNPAVIADNVGDNVGDVAGMGADLFESFCGSILAAAALGATAYAGDPDMQARAVVAPLAIAAVGALVSILGIFLVRTREAATQKDLLRSLSFGIDSSGLLVLAAAWPVLHAIGVDHVWGTWGAVAVGLATGTVIGRTTEYFTSASFRPTRGIAAAAEDGTANAIISGVSVGMLSTAVPVIAVVAGTGLAFGSASGFDMAALDRGLYGVAIAAVGMLSTLGITLASDAYGPIADNAGGNAEMAGLGPEVRERTDALDALGNTTAATGKGFAIGSAALTALALLASYFEVVRGALLDAGRTELSLRGGEAVAVAEAGLPDLLEAFHVSLLNPMLLGGVLLGAMVAFVFSGLTTQAVGRAAGLMVEEVRRQFRDRPGILAGTEQPDYARCVAISTRGAQREMIVPSVIAVAAPVLVGATLGVAGVVGLLVGGLSSGFVLAVFLANSGGAWDNAKKYIEGGHHGGKGSRAHSASVIGDTVGDPFKDTSGPSLNILIKLMGTVAIVSAGVTIALSAAG